MPYVAGDCEVMASRSLRGRARLGSDEEEGTPGEWPGSVANYLVRCGIADPLLARYMWEQATTLPLGLCDARPGGR